MSCKDDWDFRNLQSKVEKQWYDFENLRAIVDQQRYEIDELKKKENKLKRLLFMSERKYEVLFEMVADAEKRKYGMKK